MSRKLYISDTHFGHANVLKLDERPFDSIEQHDEELIHRWNDTVLKSDDVYIVGDFCWKKTKEWPQYLEKLNGKKHLILGNHDGKSISDIAPETRKYFESIDTLKEIKDGDNKVILCHYPIPFYRHSHLKNVYMLCGHVHATKEWEQLEAVIDFLQDGKFKADFFGLEDAHTNNRGQIFNVGAMMPWMKYAPKTLKEIVEVSDIYVEM